MTRCRLVLALLPLALACGDRPLAPDLPAGILLSARTEGLARLLERLAEMEGTPLARRALAASQSLPACDAVQARAASGRLAELWDEIACAEPGGDLAALHALRGDRDAVLSLPLGDETPARATVTLTLDADGSLDVTATLPPDAFDDARALLLPGAEPAGPAVLSARDRLVHARVRPDGGLDLAAFVTEGSQADQLLQLKSSLFAGAALDGTWEVAIYLPDEGSSMPHTAGALGFSRRALAVAAIEEFIEELRASWPVRRSFFAVGDADGACLLDLNLMPELAPCYVATESALVVGWNPASVRRALDGAIGDATEAAGALEIELSRFAEADARLAAAQPDATPGRRVSLPWRRLRATGARTDDAIEVRVVLEAGGEA